MNIVVCEKQIIQEINCLMERLTTLCIDNIPSDILLILPSKSRGTKQTLSTSGEDKLGN